jgi:hypothetical protein
MGPEVIADLHQRIVEIALENKIITGKRMRVDTRVVEAISTIRPTAVCSVTARGC